MSTQSFPDRMREVYARITDIEDAQRELAKEKRTLLLEICEGIGIKPGEIIERRGVKFEVIRCTGDFHHDEGEPGGVHRVWPAASCEVAPPTKTGFHATTRRHILHIERRASFLAQMGKPLPAEPEA